MIIDDKFIKCASSQILRSAELISLPREINDICLCIVHASLVLEHREANKKYYNAIESATSNGELERAILNKNMAKTLLDEAKKQYNKAIFNVISKE